MKHTAHYYLALAGITAAVVTCVVNVWAYYNEGLLLTQIAFAVVALTAAILFTTWFWGVYLLMGGGIPPQRLGFLVVHATLGSISPLLYTIAIGLQMDTLTSQPVGGSEVALEFLGVLVLLTQLAIGSLMVRRG